MSVAAPITQNAFKLKGRLFTLTVLELNTHKVASIKEALALVCQEAPKMFSHTPMVLDVSPLKGASFDLKGVVDAMRDFKMVPIAIQGASVVQQKAAVAAGLSIITASSKQDGMMLSDIPEPFKVKKDKTLDASEENRADEKKSEIKKDDDPSHTQSSFPKEAKVVTSPIRSGQQVYAKGCDLIVLAAVSRGAEVLADGNIHVYGPLRGRALAGILGNKKARIFCQQLEAELVSIAGCFKLSEDLPELTGKDTKQIYLDDAESLCIESV